MSSSRLTGKRSESCRRSVDALKNPEHIVEYHCKRLSSTLEGIQNCPFAREFENFPDSSPSSLTFTPLQSQPQSQPQPTGIIMLSLPSTDDSVRHSFPLEENEEFETPPEHNNSSQPYFSGSDDPKPGTTVNSQLSGDADSVNNDSTMAVYLRKDCDDLGFPNLREIGVPNRGDFKERTPKRIRVSEEDVDTKSSSRKIGKKLVDGNAKMSEKGEEGSDGEVHSESEGLLEVDECRIKRIVDSFTENGDEHRIERNVESSIEDGDEEVHENGGKKVDENEQLNGISSGEINGNGMKDGFNNGGSERGAMSMDLDGNEKLNGICTEKMHSSVEGRRELPSSIRGVDKNVEGVGRGVETPSFKDILEAFSNVVGGIRGNDNNVDFLETAKKRGMTFPQPRWWPPEGFDD